MEFLLEFWENINANDIIDILVVAVVIYQCLLIIRGTRTVQMVLGLGGISALFWLSLSYQLHSLHWILSHFVNSFFILVIILFQDNIRNVLVSMGRTKFFKGEQKSGPERGIDEVVEACKVFSKRKIGALIVFEKRDGLLNYIQTGTVLKSRLHTDILYAIFQSRAPLHDGAVIIGHGKIQAAGCFLPLAKNVEIDRHLGTRHRAALGVTEMTDAVVVIVSEESGKMSVCFNGIFYNTKDSDNLRNRLRQLVLGDSVEDLHKVYVRPQVKY